jgi:hypothetical protein
MSLVVANTTCGSAQQERLAAAEFAATSITIHSTAVAVEKLCDAIPWSKMPISDARYYSVQLGRPVATEPAPT